MLGMKKIDPQLDTVKLLDGIEASVYTVLKSLGFRRYGRTLHRFVSGDISQVVNFQLGQSHMGQAHLLYVNVGIRVPECFLLRFGPEAAPKKYYHEYECSIRSRLGTVEGKPEACYDLRRPIDPIWTDILRQLQETVLPAFDVLSSRDAILSRRRDYPLLDTMNAHLILLEEAMIHGRRGDKEMAQALFNRYYLLASSGKNAHQGHLRYLRELAAQLNIPLEAPADRVRRMEACFDDLQADPSRTDLHHILVRYQESGLWLADYELEEQGAFSPELKRGVLSQDALYDLLQETKTLYKPESL